MVKKGKKKWLIVAVMAAVAALDVTGVLPVELLPVVRPVVGALVEAPAPPPDVTSAL